MYYFNTIVIIYHNNNNRICRIQNYYADTVGEFSKILTYTSVIHIIYIFFPDKTMFYT